MKEMYRSYVEMLVSTALDPDMIQALEDTNGAYSFVLVTIWGGGEHLIFGDILLLKGFYLQILYLNSLFIFNFSTSPHFWYC